MRNESGLHRPLIKRLTRSHRCHHYFSRLLPQRCSNQDTYHYGLLWSRWRRVPLQTPDLRFCYATTTTVIYQFVRSLLKPSPDKSESRGSQHGREDLSAQASYIRNALFRTQPEKQARMLQRRTMNHGRTNIRFPIVLKRLERNGIVQYK